MLRGASGDDLEDRREFGVANEANDRGFGVAPGQIAEQLTDGLVVHLRAAPELAFGYEDVRALVTYEDIGLPFFVEGFAGGGWIMGTQVRQQKVSEVLFVLAVVSARVAFHGNAE